MVTTTAKPPTVDRSAVLSAIVNWLGLRKESVCGVPANVAVESGRNPLPSIVNVNGPDPTWAEGGERVVMAGTGLFG